MAKPNLIAILYSNMFNFIRQVDFTGFTLVLPCCTVGNVSQLSTDLIISSLNMEKVGVVWDPAIIPVIGPPAYQHDSHDKITTASDLYASEDKKIAILQIRSPLTVSLMTQFFEKLTEFIKLEKLARFVILTGSYVHEKHLVGTNPFEYKGNSLAKEYFGEKLQKVNLAEFTGNVIHGGGYADRLFKFCDGKGISTLVLFKYVSEGDNSSDAKQLLGYLNVLLDVFPCNEKSEIQLTIPISWKYLFGNKAPLNVY